MMTRGFRLEPVLKHRRHLEDRARHAFSDAELKVRDADARLRRMKNRHAIQRDDLRLRQRQGQHVPSMVMALHYLNILEDGIRRQKDVLAELEHDMEKRRTLLLEAVKQRKAIEKLKEKQNAQWRQSQDRRERAFIDELSVTRFVSADPSPEAIGTPSGSQAADHGGNFFPVRKGLPAEPALPAPNGSPYVAAGSVHENRSALNKSQNTGDTRNLESASRPGPTRGTIDA
ncbi:MAG: flagellar export protein FliJ [Desulfobacterales bacterium]